MGDLSKSYPFLKPLVDVVVSTFKDKLDRRIEGTPSDGRKPATAGGRNAVASDR
jgi:hypothetical protein